MACTSPSSRKTPARAGAVDTFTRDGHEFDVGPTLFVMPLVYEAEFAALGASMHEMLDLQRVDPTYHLVFDDGSGLSLTSDLKSMREQLEPIEPGSFAGFLRYLDEGNRHYQIWPCNGWSTGTSAPPPSSSP